MNAPVIFGSPSRMPAAVQRGRDLLDSMLGEEWRDRVDLQELDIETNGCILGQLFGNYKEGLKALGLSSNAVAAHHGFYATSEQCGRYRDPHSRLNYLWRKAIRS